MPSNGCWAATGASQENGQAGYFPGTDLRDSVSGRMVQHRCQDPLVKATTSPTSRSTPPPPSYTLPTHLERVHHLWRCYCTLAMHRLFQALASGAGLALVASPYHWLWKCLMAFFWHQLWLKGLTASAGSLKGWALRVVSKGLKVSPSLPTVLPILIALSQIAIDFYHSHTQRERRANIGLYGSLAWSSLTLLRFQIDVRRKVTSVINLSWFCSSAEYIQLCGSKEPPSGQCRTLA